MGFEFRSVWCQSPGWVLARCLVQGREGYLQAYFSQPQERKGIEVKGLQAPGGKCGQETRRKLKELGSVKVWIRGRWAQRNRKKKCDTNHSPQSPQMSSYQSQLPFSLIPAPQALVSRTYPSASWCWSILQFHSWFLLDWSQLSACSSLLWHWENLAHNSRATPGAGHKKSHSGSLAKCTRIHLNSDEEETIA